MTDQPVATDFSADLEPQSLDTYEVDGTVYKIGDVFEFSDESDLLKGKIIKIDVDASGCVKVYLGIFYVDGVMGFDLRRFHSVMRTDRKFNGEDISLELSWNEGHVHEDKESHEKVKIKGSRVFVLKDGVMEADWFVVKCHPRNKKIDIESQNGRKMTVTQAQLVDWCLRAERAGDIASRQMLENRKVRLTLDDSEGSLEKLFERLRNDKDQLKPTKRVLNFPIEIFRPAKTVEIQGQKFYLGYPIIDKYDTSRILIIAFVEKDGHFIPRLFYKSISGVTWRVAPTMSPHNGGEHFSKGFEGGDKKGRHSYAQENQLHPELAEHVLQLCRDNKVTEIDAIIERHRHDAAPTVYDLGQALLGIFNRKEPYTDKQRTDDEIMHTYTKEVKYFEDPELDHVSMVCREFANSEHFRGISFLKKVLRAIEYPRGFIPDFRKKPIKIERDESGQNVFKSVITREDYYGVLGCLPVIWTMAHDDLGRVWVESIRFKNAKITSYGNCAEPINAGVITNKPADYVKYIPSAFRHMCGIWYQGQYFDVTPILDNLKPIALFRRYKHIS